MIRCAICAEMLVVIWPLEAPAFLDHFASTIMIVITAATTAHTAAQNTQRRVSIF